MDLDLRAISSDTQTEKVATNSCTDTNGVLVLQPPASLPERLLDALNTTGIILQFGKHRVRRDRSAFEQRSALLEPRLSCFQSTIDELSHAAGSAVLEAAGSTSRAVALVYRLTHVYAKDSEREALTQYRRWREQNTVNSGSYVDDAVVGALCAQLLERTLACIGTTEKVRCEPRRFKKSFSELLDVLDTLTLLAPDVLMAYATDYAQNQRAWRARRLLRTHLDKHPDDASANTLYWRLRAEHAASRGSIAELREAVESRPGDAQPRLDLADYLGSQLEFATARDALSVTKTPPDDARLAVKWHELQRLEQIQRSAEAPTAIPSIAPSATEIEQKNWHSTSLALATHLYRQYGTLQLDGIFPNTLLSDCLHQFVNNYKLYLEPEPRDDALSIGHRRRQISLALSGAFNSPDFYANPLVLTLMQQLIGRKVIIGSMVAATSFPGAREQHWHKDHRALFTHDADSTPLALPPVAISVMIPLIELDDATGSTQVKKGSHLLSRRRSKALTSQTPRAPLGSCFLMDLALSHRGQANRSQYIRPIVNMVYQQHWFQDNKNFKSQRPLDIRPGDYRRIPEAHRRLFDWAVQPGARVNR